MKQVVEATHLYYYLHVKRVIVKMKYKVEKEHQLLMPALFSPLQG